MYLQVFFRHEDNAGEIMFQLLSKEPPGSVGTSREVHSIGLNPQRVPGHPGRPTVHWPETENKDHICKADLMGRLPDVCQMLGTLTPAHWSPHLFLVQQHELCVWRQTQEVGFVGHDRPVVLQNHCHWIAGAEAEKLRSCGKKTRILSETF